MIKIQKYLVPITYNPTFINDKPQWKEVDGTPVIFKGYEEFSFFVYDAKQIHPAFGFRVCEATTGGMIIEGTTRLSAINQASRAIRKHSKESIQKGIKKAFTMWGKPKLQEAGHVQATS